MTFTLSKQCIQLYNSKNYKAVAEGPYGHDETCFEYYFRACLKTGFRERSFVYALRARLLMGRLHHNGRINDNTVAFLCEVVLPEEIRLRQTEELQLEIEDVLDKTRVGEYAEKYPHLVDMLVSRCIAEKKHRLAEGIVSKLSKDKKITPEHAAGLQDRIAKENK